MVIYYSLINEGRDLKMTKVVVKAGDVDGALKNSKPRLQEAVSLLN